MYVVLFFAIFTLSQFITNKMLEIGAENKYSYEFDKKEGLVILALFLISIPLSIFSLYHFLILIGYSVGTLIICLLTMNIRKQRVEKIKEEMKLIYDILQKLVDPKKVGFDFSNVPFELKYKYGNINRIDVTIEPTAFDDKFFPLFLDQLNNFLPTYTWQYELQLEKRLVSFVGKDKPPNMVRWPGSWLQDYRFYPLGVSGDGEVGLRMQNISAKNLGKSQFKDSEGNPLKIDTSMSYQPHSLCSGTTGSGKAIWAEQELDV